MKFTISFTNENQVLLSLIYFNAKYTTDGDINSINTQMFQTAN